MAQIGIHGMVGVAIKKWIPARAWLMLGIVLGSMLPDLDNLAVAAATVAKQSTAGLHRTATHSLLAVALVVVIFYLVSKMTRQPRWNNLGLGIGAGMLLHIGLDLLIWFNGVGLLWPLPVFTNLWGTVTPPVLLMKLMDPLELLFLVLFFFTLDRTIIKRRTDLAYLKTLRLWTGIEAALFIVFTILLFDLSKGFATIFGAVYLLSLILALGVTIRLRKTIEAA